MKKYVVSVIACQTCLSYETDKPPFFYFPVASLVDDASAHLVMRGISPRQAASISLALYCTLAAPWSGVSESDRHKAHQCTRIPYGILLAFMLLNQREQQLAGSPFGYGCVYVHIDALAVTIK